MKITKKIASKEQLFNLLTDNLIDESRADVISESAYILSREGFDNLFSEHKEIESEIGEDYVTLIFNENITDIVDYFDDLTDDDIRANFGFYSHNVIATDEDGRGMLFIEG